MLPFGVATVSRSRSPSRCFMTTTPISRITTVCEAFNVCPVASAREAPGWDSGVFLATDKVQRRYQDRSSGEFESARCF